MTEAGSLAALSNTLQYRPSRHLRGYASSFQNHFLSGWLPFCWFKRTPYISSRSESTFKEASDNFQRVLSREVSSNSSWLTLRCLGLWHGSLPDCFLSYTGWIVFRKQHVALGVSCWQCTDPGESRCTSPTFLHACRLRYWGREPIGPTPAGVQHLTVLHTEHLCCLSRGALTSPSADALKA